MEQLDWETNMSFPWSNINYPQQQIEENIIFSSENIFSDPIQHHPKPGSEGKNVIPLTRVTSLDCLLSATNGSAYYTTSSPGDGISVIFSDCKDLCNEDIKNLHDDVVSSDDSVTKETDDGDASQCSSEKKSNSDSGFEEDNRPRSKRRRSDPVESTSSDVNFQQAMESNEVISEMKEMIYRAAAFRPVSFADDDVVEKPRRKNVRISSDPQTVAARKRRERISERIRVLQKLVPGGNKMDTASMLVEAANYLKFLRSQVKALEQFGDYVRCSTTTNAHSTNQNIIHNVTLGVPFPLLHNPLLLPHQQFFYPTLPPA